MPHISHASDLIHSIMKHAHEMTITPSKTRMRLLQKCLPLIAELRSLNVKHFSNAKSNAELIDMYEGSLKVVANAAEGGILEDHRDGQGNCAVCGTQITHWPKLGIVFCERCSESYMAAKRKLCSPEGFNTDAFE